MASFLQFLFEANSSGSKFEQKIADSVNSWLKSNGLSKRFLASRYQSIREEDGNRDEDYSDVVVEDLKSKKRFFIECKENIKDNIITTQFDLNKDFSLTPVENKARDCSNSEILHRLAQDIQRTEQFQIFCDFLRKPMKILKIQIAPSKFYFNEEDVDEDILKKLIEKYNDLIKTGVTEADNKPFKNSLLRDSTRNLLACALLWRLQDWTRTWDICHLEDIPYFGSLIRKHYLIDKEIPAEYIQLGDDLFSLSDRNPLNIDCQRLPDEVHGRFDLKFTPRFGSGSIYITPRSKITDDLRSKCSFSRKENWPKLIESK